MRDNTISLDAALADGTQMHFGEVPRDLAHVNAPDSGLALFRDMLDLGAREADEIADKFPKVQRRVGGYNLDALTPRNAANNMAHLLVGSEGTLAFTTKVELKLWPVIRNRAVGVCHFGSFYEAMDAAQHLVKLKPIAVELVDRTMIALGRDIEMFKPVIAAAVRGDPDAVLVVEFAEEDQADNLQKLKQLTELMADLGFGWNNPQRKWGGVVEVIEPALQTAIADFRAAGLNVMMSMKEAGKPVSFVEDCAVPLPHLADYTDRLNKIFAKHGTHGTMYAHASEGCLHVRPVLNLRLEKDVQGDARHRRRNLRHGARVQGLAFRRAWRRHRALGIPRGDVRRAHRRRLQGSEAPLRSRTMCSIPARSSIRPKWMTARCSAIRRTIACAN